MKDITLSKFPHLFEPLVVVTGDRREDRPKTKGDLLAYSVSNIDITFLFDLGLKPGTPIVSDKVFVLEEDKYIREKFGVKNILSIGSPAVNLLSRKINDSSLFYFDIPEIAKIDARKHESIIDDIKFSPVELILYQEIFKTGLDPDKIIKLDLVDYQDKLYIETTCRQLYEKYKKLNLSEVNWKQLMHNFDRPGIFDPIDDRKHAVTIKAYNDFGLISIALNPFSNSDDKYVITVAGIHGIASAYGVRLLSNHDSFSERPFGGIFETQFPEFGSWSDKLDKAQIKWQTEPYIDRYSSIEDIIFLIKKRAGEKTKKFGFFISSPYNDEDDYLKMLNNSIEDICNKMFSSTKTAYSIKTSGKGTFTKVIEDRIHKSEAIIHLLNKFRPGVLFEIGLSLGFKKRAFLIWDKKLSSMRAGGIPDVLEKINIIQVDSSIKNEFESKIREDILNVALGAEGDMLCPRSEIEECFIQGERQKDKNNRLFLFVSKTFNRFKDTIIEIASNDYNYNPFDDTELKGEGILCKFCYGIVSSSKCIFIIDKNERDGIVLLGLASGLKKQSMLFRKEAISMWEGDFKKLKQPSLKKDIINGLHYFFNKYSD